ncbi:MAG: shikimate dehydrogenase [Chloroflexota bacterium]|nr:shikimate dehydrogenase [Chloroflexota bacterium]
MPEFVGLIGYPLRHSLSPHFQQAALDYYGLDICYQAWETAPEELEIAIARLKEPQNLGANVTVPYKEAVLPLLDQVDRLANLIGAVNTIVNRNGSLWGYNTDAHGFMKALKKQGDFEAGGKRAAILGAGGAARAVGFALVKGKAASLLIANRTLKRSQALAGSLRHYISQSELETEVRVLTWPSLASSNVFYDCNLVVNCTTIGMKYGSSEGQSPLGIDVIPERILVYDLIYNPYPTPLLYLAREAGANILGGLPMLVYQGAASFELWTGEETPIDIMYNKAEEMLLGGER